MIKNMPVKLMLVTLAALAIGCDREKGNLPFGEGTSATGIQNHLEDAPEELKELGWLVGSWVDQDEDIDVTSTYRWDKSGHFLIEHFVMEVPDKDNLEGYQVIGWDPAENRLRSWLFDTDGGFGQSVWLQQDNSWISSTVFTLSDGRKASATHVYTKIDDNTYTFESENRDIDGEVLPDIGPFTVVKKK